MKGGLLRLARDRGLRSALSAFALSRVLVFAVFILCGQLNIFDPYPPAEFHNARISVRHIAFARIMHKTVSTGDANWYIDIAVNGYERRPYASDTLHNWAFFPAYPLTVAVVSQLTGAPYLTGAVLSTLFFFIALLLVYRTTLAFGFEEADANRTVFYLAIFPLSYFYSVPITESLFLMLTAGSIYAARRERWLVAGLLGAVASATRLTGVLLLPTLVLLYWETYRTFRPRLNFLPLLLIPTGLAAFMYFLYVITGNPLAFKDIIVEAWHRKPQFFLVTLAGYLADPLLIVEPWNFRLLNFLVPTLALVAGVVLLKWRRWSLAAYTLATLIIALSNQLLVSQARYAMVLFPAFIVLAVVGRNSRIDHVLRTLMLILLTLMTILYARHYDFALA